MIKVQPCRFQHCLGPANTFTPERCSEMLAFGHSSNHIFWTSETFQLSTSSFTLKRAKPYVDFKNAIKIFENVFGF